MNSGNRRLTRPLHYVFVAPAPASGMAAIANGKAVAWKRMDSTEVDMHLPDVCSGDAFFFSESTESSSEDRVTTIQVVLPTSSSLLCAHRPFA